jgi:hypothetical protein
MIQKSKTSGFVLKYENDHVFNMRPDRILACVKFGLDVVTPHVSIEDRTVVGLLMFETLQYWPHTSVSLIPRLFLNLKRQLHTGSVEMVRVACTHMLLST